MNSNMDSFDVRIDDDLFEVIVTYLPIEDKLRYESVSKRFQRLVFNKQKILRISPFKDSADNLNEVSLVSKRGINVTNLSKLLKKFRFITNLEIEWIFILYPQVMETITECCNHLTAVDIDLYVRRWQTVEKFFQKFGQNLKHISFCGYCSQEVVESVFLCSPNLSSISNLFVTELNASVCPKKLVKIKGLSVNTQQDLESLLRPQLSHLIYFDTELSSDFKANDNTFKMFSNLKVFKYLKVLKIHVFPVENESTIWSKIIESIATNCIQLEYFSLECKFSRKFNAKKCFQSFIHFSGLKKLCFRVFPKNYFAQELDEQITDLRPLKNCKNILDLSLRLKNINSNLFNGIDSIVPQLRQLTFEFGLKITDEVLESMAKLKNLVQIEITSDVLEITSEGLRVVTNDCKRLKSFTIDGVIRVNDNNERKSIKKLIETHPNIQFDFKRIEEIH